MIVCSNADPLVYVPFTYILCRVLRAFRSCETPSCERGADNINDRSRSLNIALDSCGNFYCYCHCNVEKSADISLHCKFLEENEVLKKDLCAVHVSAGQNNASKPCITRFSTQNLIVYCCNSTSTNTKFLLTGTNTLQHSVLGYHNDDPCALFII